jgi:hypothetical protein
MTTPIYRVPRRRVKPRSVIEITFHTVEGDGAHAGVNLLSTSGVESIEGRRDREGASEGSADPGPAPEVTMATFVAAMDTPCPLCGSPVLSFGRDGRVLSEDIHAIPLHRHRGSEGYTLCDDCAVLALLPMDLTVN